MLNKTRVLARSRARTLTVEEAELVAGGTGWKYGTRHVTYGPDGNPIGWAPDAGSEYDA